MRSWTPSPSSPPPASITGSFVTTLLLVVALLFASYPLTVGLGLLAILVLALTGRAVSRRVRSGGVGLPGSSVRLRVVGPRRCASDGDGRCYSVTVQVTDR